LIEEINRNGLAKSQKLLGREYDVLVEELADETGREKGKTTHGRSVDFAGTAEQIGTMRRVRITQARLWTLSGEPV